MDSVTLGKKIKEARLKKKLTQNEVVGDFITRNMLSQIESGTANPSVKTLEYLCRVLEIPSSQLIDEQTPQTVGEYAQLRASFTASNASPVSRAKPNLLSIWPVFTKSWV